MKKAGYPEKRHHYSLDSGCIEGAGMMKPKASIGGYSTVTGYPQSKDYQGSMKTRGITYPVSQRPNKRLYSIKEASVYLGRTAWALREMLWAGKIPYIKDGRRILLDIQDMDKWIESNKTQFTF